MSPVVEILGTLSRFARLRIGGESGVVVNVDFYSDGLGDLVRATRGLSQGWREQKVEFLDFPIVYSCTLEREDERLRVVIREFADSSARNRREPEPSSTTTFEFRWREFAHDLLVTMERQLALLGHSYSEQYRHPYPTEAIEDLRRYLGLVK